MSHVIIKRYEREVAVTLSSDVSLSQSLRMTGVAGGLVSVAAMSSSATVLQMWGSNSEGGEYRRIRKTDGTVADVALAGAAGSSAGFMYSLPDEVFAVGYLKVVLADSAGDGTAGFVSLKS